MTPAPSDRAPARIVHLGLGNFFRAHQAWYTQHAPDAAGWGIDAFTGRHPGVVPLLAAQGCHYTLVTRGPDGDRFETLDSVVEVHSAADHGSWLARFRSPGLAVVTLTVTEAGYRRAQQGGLDTDDPEVQADLAVLRGDRSGVVRTVPARLLAGLAARAEAGLDPVTVVSCDNLPANGEATASVVREFARLVDPPLIEVVDGGTSFVTTMVDRITPRSTPEDLDAVERATGRHDGAPVVTEPFSEWVLGGEFVSGRPAWHESGAVFSEDVATFERRKVWLLNGAHSLLAYAGSIRGHRTVAEAVADPVLAGWVAAWWDEAAAHLSLPEPDILAYREALWRRFQNPRIRHALAQIAADGSQKIPARVLPVLRAERRDGRMPVASCRILAAWFCHLRGAGAPVTDADGSRFVEAAAGPGGLRRVLDLLEPGLASDSDLVAAIRASMPTPGS